MSDPRIQAKKTELTTYPDETVVCGPWQRHPKDANTILNPSLIVEVLSPSTEPFDRGEKLDHYKQIPTLRAVLLIATDRREVEIWSRLPEASWTKRVVSHGT